MREIFDKHVDSVPIHLRDNFFIVFDMTRKQLLRTCSDIETRRNIIEKLFKDTWRYEDLLMKLWMTICLHPHFFLSKWYDKGGQWFSFVNVVRESHPHKQGKCPLCGGDTKKVEVKKWD